MGKIETIHTKGRWKFDDDFYGCKYIKGGKAGRSAQAQYKKIAYTTGLAEEKEDRANAKLMAAAPEMLVELLRLYEKHGGEHTLKIIKKAVLKP